MIHNAKHWLSVTTLALLLAGCGQQALESDLWTTDYNAALATATAENKYLLVDFSGSDWCTWCIRLDREVFSQPAFIEFAKENLELVVIDFPRQNTQTPEQQAANNALAQRFDVQAFPTVLILSPRGDVLQRTGYLSDGPEAYVKMIKKVIGQ